MTDVSILAIDFAKHSFQVCATTAEGVIVFNRKFSRGKLSELLASHPACMVAMEACATSHYWGREAQSHGHDVRLIPPIYVKPFVKRNKNDANDAAAIAVAVRQPDMRFVAVKSPEQQAQAMLFRTHQTFTRQRSQLLITLRGHLAEHGIIVTKGNLLGQDFFADGPNQKWAGDISYIWTSEGWLYLAVILDLYSGRVIGWAVSSRMKRGLAIRALDMAVALRQPLKGCIHHTDRGSQYCSGDYQKRLSKHDCQVSMSGKGNCYENFMVETFFKSLKAELIWRNRWETRRKAEGAIFQYINGFYNPRRRHSSLGGKSPLAFERKAA